MSLQAALSLLLDEYPKAMTRTFAGDPVAEFVRKDIPQALRDAIGVNPRYVTRGSPGQGAWAQAPWAAVFDRFVTDTAQDGYYVVYLVREDFAGVYLSLNQGITSTQKQYRTKAKSALRVRAADFLARLGSLTADLHIGEIDLAAGGATNLSAFYEAGNICSIYYSGNELPGDDRLNMDLRRFVDLYYTLG